MIFLTRRSWDMDVQRFELTRFRKREFGDTLGVWRVRKMSLGELKGLQRWRRHSSIVLASVNAA